MIHKLFELYFENPDVYKSVFQSVFQNILKHDEREYLFIINDIKTNGTVRIKANIRFQNTISLNGKWVSNDLKIGKTNKSTQRYLKKWDLPDHINKDIKSINIYSFLMNYLSENHIEIYETLKLQLS